MNCTGVTSRNSHTPQVNQGSAGIGTQVSSVAPVASAMKAPARMIASASTPVSAMVTRVRIDFSSASGDSKVRWQPALQK
jgi:hypothetical protein